MGVDGREDVGRVEEGRGTKARKLIFVSPSSFLPRGAFLFIQRKLSLFPL